MNEKEHILTALRDQFNRWEELLASMSEEQITAPHLPSDWSIKDVIAHLGPGSSVPSHGWKPLCSIGNPSFPCGLRS